MASGSSGRANSGGSKGFDFGSDDILCSYEVHDNPRDSSNETHSDPVITSSSAKDYHKSRMARSSVFKEASYNQPEDAFCQDMVSMVERCMKRHSDNLMRVLEGLSSRLSQLELYCYNLDKSIGEMRADLVHDHGEADSKLKSVEKHLQEVLRSVQVLRDKQELADTQKELSKLQLVQKESSSLNHSQSGDEKATAPVSDPKTTDCTSEMHNQQLALALPHQVMPQQQSTPVPPPSQAPQNVVQPQSYYMPPAQLHAPAAMREHPQQGQYLPPDSQFRAQQIQEISGAVPHPQQHQVNQMPPGQQFPPYQHQWSQQLTQQVQPSQQPSMQPQGRPPSTTVYSPYPPPGQGTNPSPPELHHNTIPVQVSYTAVSQPLSSRVDTVPYGYGAGRPVLQQPQHRQIKGTYEAPTADVYATTTGPPPALPPGSTYMMMYDGEGGRAHIPPQQHHFAQGGYPPQRPHLSLRISQPTAGSNMLPSNPSSSYSHFIRSHPYSELIEKLVSMGFRGDHVLSVIQRMEESGQPVDFNAVLDRLNMHSSGGPQRAWSG